MDDFKNKIEYCINRREIREASLEFLKEHTVVSNILYEILINIPTDLINMIIEYTVEKANPQKILEICTSLKIRRCGNIILFYIAIYDYTIKELQEFILEGWNINNLGRFDGFYFLITPLNVACYQGRYNLIKFYLGHGADPNIENERGYNPLFSVLDKYRILNQSNDAKKIIDLLRKYNLKLNIPEHPWFTSKYLKDCGLVEDLNIVS